MASTFSHVAAGPHRASFKRSLEPAPRPLWQRRNPYRRQVGPAWMVSCRRCLGSAAIARVTTQTLGQWCPVSNAGAQSTTGSARHRPAAASLRRAPGLDAAGVRRSPAGSAGGNPVKAQNPLRPPPRRCRSPSPAMPQTPARKAGQTRALGVFEAVKNRLSLGAAAHKPAGGPIPSPPPRAPASSSKAGNRNSQASAKAGSTGGHGARRHA